MSDGVDAPSGGPGSALKSAREALNVSEREVADALNLPLNVVEAMEANDYKNLPPAVFTRGYMRSYAKLLELDPEAIIARLPESAQPEVTLTAEMAAVEPTSRKLTDQPVWLRGAAIGALSILVIIVAVWLWPDADEALDTVPISAEAVTVPVVSEPKTLAPANQPAGPAASAAVADDRLGSGVEPEVNTLQLPELVPGQAEVTESPGEQISSRPESPDDVSTLRDRTSAPLVSGDAPGPAEAPRNQPTVPAAQQLAPAPTPSGMRRISPFGDDVLSISFVQDCWVDVKDRDGNRLYGDLNRAGTTIQLIGRAPFRVLLGYAPGVQMTFNDDVVEITQYTRNNVASLTVGG